MTSLIRRTRAYFLMVFLQFGLAGLYVISVSTTVNHFVLVVYRNAIAAIVFAPFAWWFERDSRPKLTLPCFMKILLMGLLEPVLDQNLYYMGTKATSASYAATFDNVFPAIAFTLAVILRVENISLKKWNSRAKIAGTAVTLAGALVMLLYKGHVVPFDWTRLGHVDEDDGGGGHRWASGTFMLFFSCFFWAAFVILQSHTLTCYPAELSLTTLICLMGMLEGGAVALAAERRLEPWVIGLDSRLFAVVYSGVMCSGVSFYVQGLVMKERGPVFATSFTPLCMIIASILGSFILHEHITTGMIIGGLIIVMGLYLVMWGKSKDSFMGKPTLTLTKNIDDNHVIIGGLSSSSTVNDLHEPPIMVVTDGKQASIAQDSVVNDVEITNPTVEKK